MGSIVAITIRRWRCCLLPFWVFMQASVAAESLPTATATTIPIRVGIFQNKPITYFEDGPRGLFVEILNHVAERENWKLQYILCELPDCLDALADGRLDLIASLGETPNRMQRFIFSKESIWTFWGTVWAKDHRINNIFDLKEKRVGVKKSGKIAAAFKQLAADFNIPVAHVEFDNYEAAFAALAEGNIDAVAVNNTYAFSQQKDDARLIQTPIVYNPFSAYFAVSKTAGKTALLARIDHHVNQLKADKNSLYFDFQKRWIGLPTGYWSSRKIGLLSFLLLVVSVITMAAWRYRSVVQLNRTLRQTIADRQQAEWALEKSEVRYRRIVETANEGIWSTDADHRTTFVNPILAHMLGYTPEEMVGRPVDDFVAPQDLADHKATIDRRAQGENQRYERRFVRKDGSEIWALVSATAMMDSQGAFKGAFAMLTDITRRKRLDQAINGLIQASSQSFGQAFLDSMAVGMSRTLSAEYIIIGKLKDVAMENVKTVSVVADGKIVPNIEYSLAGTPCEDVMDKAVCSHSCNVADLFPKDVMLREMGVEAYVGIPLFHSNKSPMGVMAALFKTPLPDTQLAEVIMTFFSLRIAGEIERLDTETELRERHNQFLTVLDGIDASIYVGDMQTHEILFMNKHKKEVFGADLTGQICWQALRGDSAPCPFCRNAELLDAEGNPAGVRVWEDHNAVTGRWYLNHDRAIKWVDDRLVKLQVATDVTPMKEMEAERQEYRTRIQQMQKLEAIGTLAGGIAHDFNNILSSVIGYSEIALDDELPPDAPARESLNNVLKAALRAKELVRQILAFSRQTQYDKKPITLAPMIKEALKLLRASLPATIEIRQRIQAETGSILGDATQIHQVLMNLCTNAGYAMRDSGGILELTLSEVTVNSGDPELPQGLAPGDYVRLTVADTGPGMTPMVLEQIFDPFFTTKPMEEGTGLGLSVVHGIVNDHDGTITVDSQPGQGSVFSVYLPRVHGSSAPDQPEDRPPLQGRENILVVEDEPGIARAIKTILERLGYTVTPMTDSHQALDLFSENPLAFDMVITDQTMPEMTGDQLALKILDQRADIPIIMCTGFSHTIDADKARAMGIRDFIMKPVLRRDLAAAIRRVLDHREQE